MSGSVSFGVLRCAAVWLGSGLKSPVRHGQVGSALVVYGKHGWASAGLDLVW